jgi:hypothetical protein
MVFSLFGVNRFKSKTTYFNLPPVHKSIAINDLFSIAYKNKIIIERKLCFPVNYDPSYDLTRD